MSLAVTALRRRSDRRGPRPDRGRIEARVRRRGHHGEREAAAEPRHRLRAVLGREVAVRRLHLVHGRVPEELGDGEEVLALHRGPTRERVAEGVVGDRLAAGRKLGVGEREPRVGDDARGGARERRARQRPVPRGGGREARRRARDGGQVGGERGGELALERDLAHAVRRLRLPLTAREPRRGLGLYVQEPELEVDVGGPEVLRLADAQAREQPDEHERPEARRRGGHERLRLARRQEPLAAAARRGDKVVVDGRGERPRRPLRLQGAAHLAPLEPGVERREAAEVLRDGCRREPALRQRAATRVRLLAGDRVDRYLGAERLDRRLGPRAQ